MIIDVPPSLIAKHRSRAAKKILLMRIKTLLIVLIFTAPLTLCSQVKAPSSETEKIIDDFFKTYKDKGHKDAITKLLTTNKWITKEDADNVAKQLKELIIQVGQYYGYEKIGERYYGKSIIQYIYVVKYERQPLKFVFRFYRPNDKWQTQSFKYEVDFMDELDEAGRAYRFKENLDIE